MGSPLTAYHRHSSYRPLYQALEPSHVRLLRITPHSASGENLYQLLEVPLQQQESLCDKSQPESEDSKVLQHKYLVLATSVADDSDSISLPILSIGGGEHIIEIGRALHQGIEEVAREFCPPASLTPQAFPSRQSDGKGQVVDGLQPHADLCVWTEGVCVDRSSRKDVEAQTELLQRILEGAERVMVWDGARLVNC